MDWTDLAITVPVENIDEAAAVAQMVAGAGIYIEDYSDLEEKTLEIAHIDLIDEELIQKIITYQNEKGIQSFTEAVRQLCKEALDCSVNVKINLK